MPPAEPAPERPDHRACREQARQGRRGCRGRRGGRQRPARRSRRASTASTPARPPPAPRRARKTAAEAGDAAAAAAVEDLKGLPKPVRQAIRKDKVLVLLFWNGKSADDKAVRAALRKVDRWDGRVCVQVAPIKKIAKYGRIARGVDVEQSPTIVVADRELRAETLVGYVDTTTIDQAVVDAFRNSPGCSRDAYLTAVDKVCVRTRTRTAFAAIPYCGRPRRQSRARRSRPRCRHASAGELRRRLQGRSRRRRSGGRSSARRVADLERSSAPRSHAIGHATSSPNAEPAPARGRRSQRPSTTDSRGAEQALQQAVRTRSTSFALRLAV